MRRIALLSVLFFAVSIFAAIAVMVSPADADVTSQDVCFREIFERTTGKPKPDSMVFSSIEALATVRVYSDGWLDRASAAQVMINEEVVFQPNDFNRKVSYLERPVQLLEGDNTISVNLMGMPGATLTVEIVRDIQAEAINGTVNLPSKIRPERLQIQTPFATASPAKDGTFEITAQSAGPFFVTALLDTELIAISLFNPETHNYTLSCKSTAVTLSMIKGLTITMPMNLLEELTEIAEELPQIETLAGIICSELEDRTDVLSQPSEDFQDALVEATEALLDAVYQISLQAQ